MDSPPPDSPDHPDRDDAVVPWRELVSHIGREVAAPLSAAIERVLQLTATGRIDRDSLQALRVEIERARHVGIVSQQIARLAAGADHAATERLDLVRTLHLVLAHRAHEASRHGIRVTQQQRAILVLVDPPLLSTLLNAVLDWANELTRSDVDFHAEISNWPATARLTCSFAYAPDAGHVLGELAGSSLDSLNWKLVAEASRALDITVARSTDDTRVVLQLDFPRTTARTEIGLLSDVETIDQDSVEQWPDDATRAMVMAVVGDPTLQAQLDTATADFAIDLDFVDSIAQARRACRQSMPDVIVFDAQWRAAVVNELLPDLAGNADAPALIDITADGASSDHEQPPLLQPTDRPVQRVPAMALLQRMPDALAAALRQRGR